METEVVFGLPLYDLKLGLGGPAQSYMEGGGGIGGPTKKCIRIFVLGSSRGWFFWESL